MGGEGNKTSPDSVGPNGLSKYNAKTGCYVGSPHQKASIASSMVSNFDRTMMGAKYAQDKFDRYEKAAGFRHGTDDIDRRAHV